MDKISFTGLSHEKTADPLLLGLGGLATAATTFFGMKEIAARRALMAELQREHALKRKILGGVGAGLASAAVLGGVAGYIAAKKQPSKIERTTVVQPIVMSEPEVAASSATPAKVAHELLKWAASRRSAKIESDRRKLRESVRPFGGVYKTKGAKGWDVMVDAMLGDTSSTGAGK